MHSRFKITLSKAGGYIRSPYRRIRRLAESHPKTITIIKFATLYGIFWIDAWRKMDPDFGWHLKAGEITLRHGLPTHDIFTYTAPSFPWINHEWASDMVLYLIHSSFGFVGLATAYALLWTLPFWLLARKARLFTLILAACAVMPFSGIRSIAWSVLGFSILIRLLESKSRRAVLFIPLIFLVWANIHGGFVAGFALVGYYALRYRRPQLWVILAASTLMTFINPYGPRLYEEIARTMTDAKLHRQIREWMPFNLPLSSLTLVAIWLAGFLTFTKKRLRDWFSLGPILLAASLSSARHFPLFAITVVRDIDDFITKGRQLLPRHLDGRRRAIVVLFCACITAWLVVPVVVAFSKPVNREARYPHDTLVYLSEHSCDGRLFNAYHFGGYLIWKLPQVPVYIDGRMPSWRDEEGKRLVDNYFDSLRNDTVRHREFARYDIRCALLDARANKTTVRALQGEGWRVVSSDSASVLLIAP